jgi:hypothetical protein
VREIAFALIHCSGGDILITTVTLAAVAALARYFSWTPVGRRVVFTAIVLGAAYTIFSEWLNVQIRRGWSYTAAMPVLPFLGTGLTPLLQWLIVPTLALAITGGRYRLHSDRRADGGRLHLKSAPCYAGFGKNSKPRELRGSTVKRSLLLRCLVLLLSLALVSGNAHAALHLGSSHHEHCPEEHTHHHGKTPLQHHHHDHGLACCCDCLGCSSAVYIAPALGITPADLPAHVHYYALTASLSGRTLRPDHGPPRPGTLS